MNFQELFYILFLRVNVLTSRFDASHTGSGLPNLLEVS